MAVKTLTALVACLAVFATANAQTCPITAAEANSINFGPVPAACCELEAGVDALLPSTRLLRGLTCSSPFPCSLLCSRPDRLPQL